MSRQMALALFADYSPTDRGVDDAPLDLGFRRNNALIKIVDLSLAGRRMIDVAYFLAAEDIELHKEYRVDLGLFRWLLNTTSRNQRHLAKIIREAQKAAIELNEIDPDNSANDFYGAVPLLGPAFVRNGEFRFELSERLQLAIKNPTTFHFLSLRYVFNSVHSKILFDRLQEYIDEGTTPWLDLQTLRAWMQCETKTYDLWKHFRNKVLMPATKEIKEVAKLNVEIVTMNVPGSKRVGQVRFALTRPKDGTANEQKIELIVLRSLYETLNTEFALNQTNFNEIMSNRDVFTDERIQQAIEYTRHNIERGKVKLSAGGYLMKALLDKQIHARLADEKAAKDDASTSAEERMAKTDAESAQRNQQLAKLGWDAFDSLESSAQAAALSDFCKSPTAKPLARKMGIEVAELREQLSNPAVRSSFGVFVAARVHRASKAG
jgi:hypothetical protein